MITYTITLNMMIMKQLNFLLISSLIMILFILEHEKMVNAVETANKYGLMALHTMVIGKMIWLKDMVD